MNELGRFETELLEDLRELVSSRVARRRRRRRQTVAGGLAAASFAAAAVIGVLPHGAGPLAAQRAEASVALDHAARAAEEAPATSGTYWYMRQSSRLRISTTKIRDEDNESWQRKDGTLWYRSAGSHKLTHEKVSFSLCDKQVGYRTLVDLPTDVTGLRNALRADMENNDDGPVPAKNQMDFITACAISLIGELPASREVRAAAFRLLAEQPGTKNLGTTRDALGRTGTQLSFEDKSDVILDESNGLILQWDFKGRESAVVRYVTIEAKWTDNLG